MESREAFEGNVARLRRRHGLLVRALESADPAEAEVVPGPRGACSVRHRGLLLASAYDPKAEGERLAEEMAREPADLLVAIGFGTGHHLEAYRERNSCPMVIYEPSPARLRAALAARPGLAWLGRKDVIPTHDPELVSRLVPRLYTPGLRIRVYPHPAVLRLDPEAVRDAVQRVARAKEALDITARTKVMMAERWADITVENAPALLRTPSFTRLGGSFRNVPAVIVAAGPSLDKQLPLLRENAHRLLVIAIGQTLATLRKAGIEPDFVHVVESQNVSHQLTSAGDTGNLNLVLLPSSHPSLFELPVRSRFVAWIEANQVGCWMAGALGQKRWLYSGGTVAQTAAFLAAELGANPIALIGQDLAFSGGRAYASGSAYGDVGFSETEDGQFVFTNISHKRRLFGHRVEHDHDSIRRKLVWVPGWDGEPVPTSVSYASFREHYREVAEHLAQRGFRFANCTEGGARIPGLEHQAFAELLAACPEQPVDGGAVFREAFDAERLPGPEVFREPLARAHRELDGLAREAKSGLARAGKVPSALARARSPERKIEILRGIGRYDKRITRRLAAVRWLDALIQPALHAARAAFSAADAAGPSPERAVEESAQLFETTLEGVERARRLLERLEARLGEAAGEA